MEIGTILKDQTLEVWSTDAFLGELPEALVERIETYFRSLGLATREIFDEGHGQWNLVVDLPLSVDASTLRANLLRVVSEPVEDCLTEESGEIPDEHSLALPPDLW